MLIGKGAEMAYKILIIDDDTELLKMLKSFLEIKKLICRKPFLFMF